MDLNSAKDGACQSCKSQRLPLYKIDAVVVCKLCLKQWMDVYDRLRVQHSSGQGT